MLRILAIALILAGCTKSLSEVREGQPTVYRSERSVEGFTRCALRKLETTSPGLGASTYDLRQFSGAWEIVATNAAGGNAVGFVLEVEADGSASIVTFYPGYREEIAKAREAIIACK